MELHTHTTQQINSEGFVSNGRGDYCCFALLLDATSTENGLPQQRSWCVLQLARKEYVTGSGTFREM
jgi:hypothetical protein